MTIAENLKIAFAHLTIDETQQYLESEDIAFRFLNQALDNSTPQLIRFGDGSTLSIENWEEPNLVGIYKVYEEDDDREGQIEVYPSQTDEFRIPMEKVGFDNVIWSGDAYCVIAGTTAIVVHYYAETMLERPYEEGTEVVKQAIKKAHPKVTDVLFSDSIPF